MAGIFELFRKIDDPINRTLNMPEPGGTSKKPGIRLGAPGATPAKMFGSTGNKPKGLSMRSYSALNINTASSKPTAGSMSKKQPDLLKPSLTQMDVEGNPISPRSKDRFLKAKDLKPLSMKSSSPKQKLDRASPTLKIPQNNIFKKPSTPTVVKNNKQSSYPAPEKLSHYYNEEEHFLNPEEKALEIDFEDLISALTRTIQTCDDEGFESDPQSLPCAPLPELKPYIDLTPENKFEEDSFSLPEISDDEF